MKNKKVLIPALIVIAFLLAALAYMLQPKSGVQLDEAARQQYLSEIKQADERIETNPNDAEAYVAKGVAEYNLGSFGSAEKSYQKAIELSADNYIAWNNLGNVLRDSRQYQKAEDAYRKALEINAKSVLPYTNLSKLYSLWAAKRGQTATVLEEGLRALPGNETLLQELVDYYDKSGDRAKADSYRAQLAGQER